VSLTIPGYTGFVTTETVVQTIDPKFLPEGYPRTKMVEILPETTVEVDPETGEGFLPDVLDVKAGDTVKVKWNGAEYNCTAELSPDPELPVVVIGNLAVEDIGEPFIMMFLDAEMAADFGAGVAFTALDGSTSITLSIQGLTVVQPLAPMYLPKMIVDLSDGENMVYKSSHTYEEICEAVKNNYDVLVRIKDTSNDGHLIYQFAPLTMTALKDGTLGIAVFTTISAVANNMIVHYSVIENEGYTAHFGVSL
jgi:hypothetical protein